MILFIHLRITTKLKISSEIKLPLPSELIKGKKCYHKVDCSLYSVCKSIFTFMNLHFHKLFLQFIIYYLCSKHFTEYIITDKECCPKFATDKKKCFTTVFFDKYLYFSPILRCWIDLNSNWFKSYNKKRKFVQFISVTMNKSAKKDESKKAL